MIGAGVITRVSNSKPQAKPQKSFECDINQLVITLLLITLLAYTTKRALYKQRSRVIDISESSFQLLAYPAVISSLYPSDFVGGISSILLSVLCDLPS